MIDHTRNFWRILGGWKQTGWQKRNSGYKGKVSMGVDLCIDWGQGDVGIGKDVEVETGVERM